MTSGPWVCPACGRSFGRVNQSHGCAPGTTVDEFFADRRPADRAIYEALERHLAGLGPHVVEAVGVGIMLKRHRTFAELRPKRDRLELGFLLSRVLGHPRVRRTIPLSANRTAHLVDLCTPDDVDDEVLAWLTEAYDSSPL
jgi:Domain of unknown function (DUF5655)